MVISSEQLCEGKNMPDGFGKKSKTKCGTENPEMYGKKTGKMKRKPRKPPKKTHPPSYKEDQHDDTRYLTGSQDIPTAKQNYAGYGK